MPATAEAASMNAAPIPPRGTVLAFDYGVARTGVAQGELETRLAVPLTVLATADKASFFTAIATLLVEWQPVLLVVGRPGEAREHEHGQRCERFARRLHGRYRLPVVLVDEAFSSCLAERRLIEAGHRDWRRRKPVRDALAACAILQSFFDGAPWRDAVASTKEPA
jgi:putative Holliday junction resolvase